MQWCPPSQIPGPAPAVECNKEPIWSILDYNHSYANTPNHTQYSTTVIHIPVVHVNPVADLWGGGFLGFHRTPLLTYLRVYKVWA